MRWFIVMEEHYTRCQHSTHFVLNGCKQSFSVLQYTSDIIVIPCCMKSTISTHFQSQEAAAISSLAHICLNSLTCLVSVCTSTTLTAFWFQHSQKKSRFYRLLLVLCDWEIYWHLCDITQKKSKLKSFSALCMHKWTFSETILHKTCDSLSYLW
jgi:hypothetical protein